MSKAAHNPSLIEVAEAMYQAGKDGIGKLPPFLDEVNAHTQERYLLLARAAISVTGEPRNRVEDVRLLVDLAEELAWKLNHPQQFSDRVREVLGRYAAVVGEDRITDEVRKAMAI